MINVPPGGTATRHTLEVREGPVQLCGIRALVTPAAAQKVLLWQLPWESRWGPKSLVTVLRRGLQELDVAPPPGFAWTLKCIRSGAASAAAAIDISLSKIRRQGDWSASSMVPERKYIDAMVVSTDAARRFFGWLSHGA